MQSENDVCGGLFYCQHTETEQEEEFGIIFENRFFS